MDKVAIYGLVYDKMLEFLEEGKWEELDAFHVLEVDLGPDMWAQVTMWISGYVRHNPATYSQPAEDYGHVTAEATNVEVYSMEGDLIFKERRPEGVKAEVDWDA